MEIENKKEAATESERYVKKWSFMPHEDERETPRRELLFLRGVHALIIPVLDSITIAITLLTAFLITEAWVNKGYFIFLLGENGGQVNSELLWLGMATIPVWLAVFMYFGVYKREVRRMSVSTFDELHTTWGALSIGAWLSISFILLTVSDTISFKAVWVFVAVSWILLMFILPTARAFFRVGLSFYNPFRTSALVVGGGEVGRSLIGRLNRHREYGLRVVGFLDTYDPEDGEPESDVRLLGRPSDLREIVDNYGISRVLIAFSRVSHQRILDIIYQCQEMKVDVSIVPRFFETLSSSVEMEEVEGLTMATLPHYARHGLFMRAAKRSLDLFGVFVAVILLSPLLLLVTILIKLDSKGPVLFSQERTGKNHKRFMMYKFRSMQADAESMRKELVHQSDTIGPIFKMKDDPRITSVGRVIRRLSIDELPQLINVFKGEMSLVGPRPLMVMEAAACTGTADMRHTVQPGITGLWQILGRSDIPFEEMMQLDYIYVTNWTLRWDIKIILRTFLAIIRKRGAY